MYLKKPIFLLSSERSGSNLLRSIFRAHSNISAPSPPHLLNAFYPLLPYYGDLNEKENFFNLCHDTVKVLNSQLTKWNKSFEPREIQENASVSNLLGIMDYVYAKAAEEEDNGDRLFFKEINTQEYAFQLLNGFPDAQFIYLIRDPRDFVLSSINSPNHPGDMESFATDWKNEQQKILEIYTDLLVQRKVYAIHYEDLLTNPEAILRKLCGFIEESFEDNMLEFFKKEQTQKEANQIKNWSNTQKPVLSDNFQKYLKSFSKEEIAKLEEIAYYEMMLTDYPLTSDLPKHSSKTGLTENIKKGLQLIRKLVTGKTMSLKEMKTRKNQIQTRNQIKQNLMENASPILKRQFSNYSA